MSYPNANVWSPLYAQAYPPVYAQHQTGFETPAFGPELWLAANAQARYLPTAKPFVVRPNCNAWAGDAYVQYPKKTPFRSDLTAGLDMRPFDMYDVHIGLYNAAFDERRWIVK